MFFFFYFIGQQIRSNHTFWQRVNLVFWDVFLLPPKCALYVRMRFNFHSYQVSGSLHHCNWKTYFLHTLYIVGHLNLYRLKIQWRSQGFPDLDECNILKERSFFLLKPETQFACWVLLLLNLAQMLSDVTTNLSNIVSWFFS